ncbi:MAG: hypothetical protein WC047_02620 [Kiritimatiellales bacterium]
MLMVISVFLWLAGLIGSGVAEWLPASKSQMIGEILFGVSCLGELGMYLFGWARQRTERTEHQVFQKYGLK